MSSRRAPGTTVTPRTGWATGCAGEQREPEAKQKDQNACLRVMEYLLVRFQVVALAGDHARGRVTKSARTRYFSRLISSMADVAVR